MEIRIPSVLITGALGGIGTELVRTFLEAGFKVLSTDLAPCPTRSSNGLYFQIDLEKFVNNEIYLENALQEIRDEIHGKGLDVLINNAAVQILGPVEKLTKQDWSKSLDVNLTAPFLLTQGLLHDLEKVNGCVINISSIHSRLTKRNFVAYATSKAALSGLTRAMAVELGNKVRINAIEPAAIETMMLRSGFLDIPDQFDKLINCHPQNRIGNPSEVANLALAMVRGAFEFMNGACIPLDGGISSVLNDPN